MTASFTLFGAASTAFEKLSGLAKQLKGMPVQIATLRASDPGIAATMHHIR